MGVDDNSPTRRQSDPLSSNPTRSGEGPDHGSRLMRPSDALLYGRTALSDTAVQTKTSTPLRLPSFEALGIATPHPDILRSRCARHEAVMKAEMGGQSPARVVSQALVDFVDCLRMRMSRTETSTSLSTSRRGYSVKHLQSQPGYTPLLTPPDEHAKLDWRVTSTAVNLPANVGANLGTEIDGTTLHPPRGSVHDQDGGFAGVSKGQFAAADHGKSLNFTPGLQRETDAESTSAETERPWLEDALAVLVSTLILNNVSENEVKVVCQTLPRPPRARLSIKYGASENTMISRDAWGYNTTYTPPTVIMAVTNAIQDTYNKHGRRPFIQIHHAVESSMVDLEQLPSSPPLTGGACFSFSHPCSPSYFTHGAPMIESGESAGYFARTVFNTAVPVLPAISTAGSSDMPSDLSSYDAWARKQQTAPLPSPNPIVLPLSHQISVLERYIPPASPHEDQKIFSNVSSTLVDRLFELSPNGGHLLFVYPTKIGAEAFARAYLGPILEPLLRRLMSIHGMSESFCEALDKMRAIEFMKDFEGLRARILNICSRARAWSGDPPHQPGTAIGLRPSDGSYESAGSGIELVYARKATVHLSPDDWKEWWISQESSRIKKTISVYYEMGYKMPEDMAPGDLERAIIDGVRPMLIPQMREGQGFKSRPAAAAIMTPPMEVGVFILRRTG